MQRLTVVSFDNQLYSKPHIFNDLASVNFGTSFFGGYLGATFILNRPRAKDYDGIFPQRHIKIYSPSGNVVWEGAIHSHNQDIGSVTVNCLPYSSLLSANKTGWSPSYPIVTDIAQIMRDGLSALIGNGTTSKLLYNTSTIADVGKTIKYEPENSTSKLTEIFDDICVYGTTDNRLLAWQVYGRTVYLTPKPLNTKVTYKINGLMVEANLTSNADNFCTRLSVRYRDLAQSKLETINSSDVGTDWQKVYSTRFGVTGATSTSFLFIKEGDIVDVTSHGIITFSQAKEIGKTLLKNNSGDGIRNDTSDVTIINPAAIKTQLNNSSVDLSTIRAGVNVNISNSLEKPKQGTNNSTTSMFVAETQYSMTNEKGNVKEELKLMSENSNELSSTLTRLLSNVSVLPE